MSLKQSSKASKKRKINSPDPSQHKLDRFLSASKQSSPSERHEAMEVDTTTATVKQAIMESNDSLYENQRTAITISITDLNPSRYTTITEKAFDQYLQTQKSLLFLIFSSTSDKNINFISMSRLADSLTRCGKSEIIYKALIKEMEEHVQKLKSRLLDPACRERLLPQLNKSWNTFCSHLSTIRNIFMELDRTYVLPHTKFASIIQLGKHIFSETIMDESEFRGVVVAEVLKLIKEDRDNVKVDIELIRDVLQMLIELSYYTTDFEPRFLTSTTNYYKEEASRLISTLSTKDYIEHAFMRREQEVEGRIKNYLDARTKQDLAHAVTNQLIFQRTETIIGKGFDYMMDHDMMKPLGIFYCLLNQSPKMSLLKNAYGSYIKTQGTMFIKDPSNDSSMISMLLKFKKKLDEILKNCFNDDPLFSNALKENFEAFINTRGNKPAELLAKFIDSKLKISIKKPLRNEVDIAVLDNALVLFRYIQSKDAFEVYYKRYLAKRLLLDRSYSNEIESHVLEKLKHECGYEFTKNLETMFNDIQISNDLNSSFKNYEPKQARLPINVKVIAQSTWPTYPSININVPHEMATSQKLFENFYTSKMNGRKLVWQNALSSCSIIAHYPSGNKEIILSFCQAVVLLLFNYRNPLSFAEIKAETSLDDKDLIALLKSLSSKPYTLITNGGRDTISTSDVFEYNEVFESPNLKIRIPPAMLDQTTEEQKDVEKKVLVNRQHQLEAAIVRIMKAKKTLSHADLMNEIFSELKYPVEANDIKKRIESLIDRDYLERDAEDSSLYNYQS